jgi:hypothetical protein
MASWFAGLRPLAGARVACEPPADAVVSLRMADGGEASLALRGVQARQVTAAVPWRKTRSARGQLHYPGYFWSARSVTSTRTMPSPAMTATVTVSPGAPDLLY